MQNLHATGYSMTYISYEFAGLKFLFYKENKSQGIVKTKKYQVVSIYCEPLHFWHVLTQLLSVYTVNKINVRNVQRYFSFFFSETRCPLLCRKAFYPLPSILTSLTPSRFQMIRFAVFSGTHRKQNNAENAEGQKNTFQCVATVG